MKHFRGVFSDEGILQGQPPNPGLEISLPKFFSLKGATEHRGHLEVAFFWKWGLAVGIFIEHTFFGPFLPCE